MIPDRDHCPKGWTVQSKGFLAASPASMESSEFICLDEVMETTSVKFTQGRLSSYLSYTRLFPNALSEKNIPGSRERHVGLYLKCVVCSK